MEFFNLFNESNQQWQKYEVKSKTLPTRYTKQQEITIIKENWKLIKPLTDAISKVFGDHPGGKASVFLQEIAMAETHLGSDPNTNSNPVDKGVWQINKVGLNGTHAYKSHPKLKTLWYPKIQKEFGINWLEVTHIDCEKLLQCVIACRLLLKIIPATFKFTEANTIDQVKKRGAYWKKWYNTHLGEGSVDVYVDRVRKCKAIIGENPIIS